MISAEFFYAIFSRISPVEVVTRQLPPVAVRGTSTAPVEVSAVKTLSVSSVPSTLPVLVVTVMEGASQLSKRTSPVVRSRKKLSVAVCGYDRSGHHSVPSDEFE